VQQVKAQGKRAWTAPEIKIIGRERERAKAVRNEMMGKDSWYYEAEGI
jgi:hypothetical protein